MSATPGPWVAVSGRESGGSDRWSIVSGGATPWLIAVVENGQPGDTLETEACTARLIAAAPDLLAALECYVNHPVLDWRDADSCPVCGQNLPLALAAIAKAKGEPPTPREATWNDVQEIRL